MIRFKHYSFGAENTCRSWIKQFILYHSKRHPDDINAAEWKKFLTDLAMCHPVFSSTQRPRLILFESSLSNK
ncbi:MAG: phage integrase N-terminal SAM-like domain-containing protein [Methylococcaceae bacterium]